MVPGCSQWCLVRGQRIMRAVLKQKFRDKLCHPEGNQGQERAAKGCCVTSILGGFCSKTGLHQQEGTDNEAWVELMFSHGTWHTLISSYFHNAVNPHPAVCLFILYLLSHFSYTVFLIRTYVGIKLFHSFITYLQTDVSFSVTRLDKYLNFLCNPLISLWWWLITTRLYILPPNIL